MQQIPIYVGYDPREPVAYSAFVSSVIRRTDPNGVSFHAIAGARDDASNVFGKARFCVAERQGFKGWAIWADGDMLCRADIRELWGLRESGYDVMVVKHEYSTKHPIKYLGAPNDDYPRKNWSSLMLIDCGNFPWRKVDSEYVGEASSKHLHRFEFLKDERIGDLPKEWNWLVSEYEYNPEAKLAHFTIGLPSWYPKCDYADEWREELKAMNYYEPWVDSFDDTVLVSER
jgi:hypothetical protein